MTTTDGKAEREARLAAALRANLRRRKAHAAPADPVRIPVPDDDAPAETPPAPQRPIA